MGRITDPKAIDRILKALTNKVSEGAADSPKHPPVKSMTRVLTVQLEEIERIIAHLKSVHVEVTAMIEETKKWTDEQHRAYMRSVEMQWRIEDLKEAGKNVDSRPEMSVEVVSPDSPIN